MNLLIILTDVVEKCVLLILFGLSIWSIGIIIDRRRFYKSFLNEKNFFHLKDQFKQIRTKEEFIKAVNHLSEKNLFSQAMKKTFLYSFEGQQFSASLCDRLYISTLKEERVLIEKGLSVLATLGANAPFVGLFGTVLGIIRAFAYLGGQSGSTAVMSGVSQALYATAMGLFVAIPAVVAYNIFSQQMKKSFQYAESLKDALVAQLSILEKGK